MAIPRAHRRRDTVVALIGAAALALGFAGLRALAQAPSYTATPLGTLPGHINSYAYAINSSGQVAGYSEGGSSQRAFLWQNGVMTDLGTLGGAYSGATAINDAGQVVGWSNTASGDWHAFLWQNGVMTDLGTLGGTSTGVSALNNAGQVVGWSHTASGDWHAFLWHNGVMTDLGTFGGNYSSASAINDAGQVVGEATTASGEQHAFLWQDGVMTDLGTLGGPGWAWGRAINNAGQVVGGSYTANGGWHAFLWQNGVMTDLGTLGGPYSFAYDINDAGQVVGYSEIATPCTWPDGSVSSDIHAVLWENGVIRDLHQTPLCSYGYANAINNVGQIVGDIETCYFDPSDNTTYCYLDFAFLYSAGVMTDLNTVTPGLELSTAAAINDCGQIAANSYWAAYRLDPALCAGGSPSAPANLTAAPGNTQVALTWSASVGAASYTVQRATVSGGPYVTVATGITATSYTNTGLTNGVTYYYVVQAVNGAGTSPNSNEASATPAAPPPPPPAPIAFDAASGVQESGIDASSLTYSFTVGSGLTNSILLVFVPAYATKTVNVSSITYGGLPLTKIRRDSNGINLAFSEVWYRLAPPSGATNVVVTMSGPVGSGNAIYCGAMSFSGVDQSTPIDAQTGSVVTGSHGAHADTITPVTNGAWIVDGLASQNAPAAGAAQTLKWSGGSAYLERSGGSYRGPINPAAPTAMSWTWATSGGASAHSVVALRPAFPSSPPPPPPPPAGIAFDASSGVLESGTDASSLAYPFTVGSGLTNSILLVFVPAYATKTVSVSGVTYGGLPLTKIRRDSNGINLAFSEVWYRLAPPSGTTNVVVTMSGPVGSGNAIYSGAMSFSGVDQSSPIDAHTGSVVTGSHGAHADTITPVTNGAWIVDGLASQNAPLAGVGQTPTWSGGSAYLERSGGSHRGPIGQAAPTAMSWTWATSGGASAHSVVALRPAI